MTILYSNGCSYTANFDLEPEDRYPKIIADRLGLDCRQGGEPGSCNERIIRTTIADCLTLKQTNHDIVALIQLSHVHRTEYPISLDHLDPFLSIKVIDTLPAPVDARQYADLYWRLHENKHILIKLMSGLIGLISFFNQEKIKYQIFLGPSENDLFNAVIDDFRLHHLKSNPYVLDLEKFYMLGLTKNPQRHPDKQGMQLIADYFSDRVNLLCESV